MKVRILGEKELPSVLEDLVSDSIEISIASAFLNFAGIALLEKYLNKYSHIKSIQILLDQNFHPDEQEKKSILKKLISLPNTEVRLFCDDKKLFHSKIYLFKSKDDIQVVIGSSNLTAGGLLHNVESNALLSAEDANPEIEKLRVAYFKYWDIGIRAEDFINRLGDDMTSLIFKVGDKVVIGKRPELGIGRIVEIEGQQVDVFFRDNGIAEIAHVSEIRLALEPIDMAKKGMYDDPAKFDLRTRSVYLPIANVNGILSNSVIEILPHQILAAHKIISSPKIRFLLADEVGLGKTFEAGIIIRELMSRGEVKRVLIITPAALVDQWYDDMKKFDLDFTTYQSGLEDSIHDVWNKMDLIISSIDTVKLESRIESMIKATNWDLLVFDEAHHLTRKDYGDKADKSDRYIAAEQLEKKATSILLLTATPHQGDRNKFFNLIRLIDNNLFHNEYEIYEQRQKLNEIMIRQRKIDVTDDEGKPLFVKRIVNSLRYNTTAEEDRFFDKLNDYLESGYKTAEQGPGKRYQALGFVMITFQKIAASSIYAVKFALQERLIRLLFIELTRSNNESLKNDIVEYARYKYDQNDLSDDVILIQEKVAFDKYLKEEGVNPHEFVATPNEISLLKQLLSAVPEGDETKLDQLLEAIKLVKATDPEEKIIIFTEYLYTQNYIVKSLRGIYGSHDVVFIRGGDHSQKSLAARIFKHSAHFLVSTQAGGEGINLQHCHILFNYDMPWNPMKVEQRIGRIHRYKQKDTVQVYNMFAVGTIEDRIYERLDQKLLEISQTIGRDDEQETFRENILGIVTEELDFDSIYKEALRRGQNVEEITREKIDAAIQKAKEIYEKLGDLTQDMEKFNLQKYFQTKGNISLKDLETFIINFVKSEGKRVNQDDEGNYEFLIPESIPTYGNLKYTKVTFNRQSVLEDPDLEFMAIGHAVTDSIIHKCAGYDYGGKCVKRQVSSANFKGETGIQFNYTVEYLTTDSASGAKRRVQKDFHALMFDDNCIHREELKEIAFLESQKKFIDDDFLFADKGYLERVERAASQKLQELIDVNLAAFQQSYASVIYKIRLENVALFSVR